MPFLPIIRFEIYVIVNQISNTIISTSRVAVCPQQSIQSRPTVHNYSWRYKQFCVRLKNKDDALNPEENIVVL